MADILKSNDDKFTQLFFFRKNVDIKDRQIENEAR